MADNFVRVDVRHLSFALWALGKVRGDVAAWGSLRLAHRHTINKLINDAHQNISPVARVRLDLVDINVASLKSFLHLVEALSSRVHSAQRVATDDRRKALGLLAMVKKHLRGYIQLDLFPAG